MCDHNDPTTELSLPAGPIHLTGAQFEQFQVALMSAFPDYLALAQLVRIKLGFNLAEVATGNLRETVFHLLTWAESQGRVGDLLRAACEANPGNPQLATLVTSLRSAPSTPATKPQPAAHARYTTDTLRELRGILATLYPSSIDAARVADDAGLNRARIDMSGSATTVWFNVLEEARKTGQVGDLVRIARSEYPRHADLQRLAGGASTPVQSPTIPNAPAPPQSSDALYERLTKLLPAQFEEVLFRLRVPVHQLSSANAPQAQRAMELVRYLEQRDDGVAQAQQVLERVR